MLIELINRNMRIKNIRIGLLHNMGHFRVRRVRVDHNEGGEYQDARENTPRGGRWK